MAARLQAVLTLMALLLSPAVTGIAMFLLAVVWMLRDESDRSRPILAGAILLNLFYGSVLSAVMSRADGLLPWKYDYYLYTLDAALGVSAPSIARSFGGATNVWLNLVYELLLPMMILWVATRKLDRASLVFAYVAEMVAAPAMYMVLPAVGPASTFGASWLHPSAVPVALARLNGMPNAFPSLHLATALVLVVFARGWLWRGLSMVFLAGTALATVTTGEHYVIDLIAGLAFGCFAAAAGRREIRQAIVFLCITLGWSLGIRFAPEVLLSNPVVLPFAVVFTIVASWLAVWMAWQQPVLAEQEEGVNCRRRECNRGLRLPRADFAGPQPEASAMPDSRTDSGLLLHQEIPRSKGMSV